MVMISWLCASPGCAAGLQVDVEQYFIGKGWLYPVFNKWYWIGLQVGCCWWPVLLLASGTSNMMIEISSCADDHVVRKPSNTPAVAWHHGTCKTNKPQLLTLTHCPAADHAWPGVVPQRLPLARA